jgi:hypothetical protein
MREAGGSTLEDFQNALDFAVQGAIVSGTGLPQAVEDALDAVAGSAPNPPRWLIDAAWDAYERQRA